MMILFITLTFERNGSGRRRRPAEGQAVGEMELDAFNHIYNRVCRDMVGRNYHRESHLSKLPRVLAFIVDAEGSRYWGSMRDPENLHIHSIWVIPSNANSQIEEALRSGSIALNSDVRVDAVDIQPVDQADKDSIQRVVSYSSKLIGFNTLNLGVANDFRVFPR